MFRHFFQKFAKFTALLGVFVFISHFLPEYFSLAAESAHADTDPISNIVQKALSGDIEGSAKAIIDGAQKILPTVKALQFISYPIFMVIGTLLDNQILTNPTMRDILSTVWAQVRNLANFIILIYFVFIAIYNVFASSTESSYSLKKGIKEVILGLLLINFSYFGAMLTLDAANVMINVTYSWASEYDASRPQAVIPQKNDVFASLCGKNSGFSEQQVCTDPGKREQFKAFMQKLDNQSLPFVIATRFGKVHQLDKMNTQLESRQDLTIVATFIVSLFIAIVQICAYVLLAFFLLIRIIVLWVLIAISPLIVLDKILSGLSLDTSDKFEEFFDYAIIAPVKGGIGFSLAYMFLDAVTRAPSVGTSSEVGDVISVSIGTIDTFQELIVLIGSIAVIYEITLSMADKSFAASAFSTLKSKIAGTGKLAGSLAANTGLALSLNEGGMTAGQLVNKLFPSSISDLTGSKNSSGAGTGGTDSTKGITGLTNPAAIAAALTPANISTLTKPQAEGLLTKTGMHALNKNTSELKLSHLKLKATGLGLEKAYTDPLDALIKSHSAATKLKDMAAGKINKAF